MKLVQPKFEELSIDNVNPILLGERCVRVCYKSEDLIKDGSAEKLLKRIMNAGHTAMLEHIPVYLKLPLSELQNKESKVASIIQSKYSFCNIFENDLYVSTNLRVVYEANPDYAIEFIKHNGEPFTFELLPNVQSCNYETDRDRITFEKRVTILFTMDRIGSQSFCRHRVFSFAQESTRWCNYIRDKFGSEISIITPCWLKEEDNEEFIKDMEEYEKIYFKWINKGYKAEDARAFLPCGLKTEIVMTGFIKDWKGFFKLRNDSHAHPQAQELAKPLEEYFEQRGYFAPKSISVKKEIKLNL